MDNKQENIDLHDAELQKNLDAETRERLEVDTRKRLEALGKLSPQDLQELTRQCAKRMDALVADLDRQQAKEADQPNGIQQKCEAFLGKHRGLGRVGRIKDLLFDAPNPFDPAAPRRLKPAVLLNGVLAIMFAIAIVYFFSQE